MKKYTHAWLAFMAIKRLDKGIIPEANKEDAETLVRWFHNYRDFVIEGSWYPDEVFKDMATSHIIKYSPSTEGGEQNFKKLPSNMNIYRIGQTSPLYKKPFRIESGNCADRCEALTHSIVDCFKMLQTEDRGCPISPTNNHIAMRFFILSHYIADCHMPLHCDSRQFSSGADIHGHIETLWDKEITKSYEIDKLNNRFYYDPNGYPLHKKPTNLIQEIEKEIIEREFSYGWGSGNNNTWDYISAVSEYSYLMSYNMLPPDTCPTSMDKKDFKTNKEYQNFEENSKQIFIDTIDSIARVWLHTWARYRKWAKK